MTASASTADDANAPSVARRVYRRYDPWSDYDIIRRRYGDVSRFVNQVWPLLPEREARLYDPIRNQYTTEFSRYGNSPVMITSSLSTSQLGRKQSFLSRLSSRFSSSMSRTNSILSLVSNKGERDGQENPQNGSDSVNHRTIPGPNAKSRLIIKPKVIYNVNDVDSPEVWLDGGVKAVSVSSPPLGNNDVMTHL